MPPPPRDLAHDLSVALMLVLERLSPLERVVFVLRNAFDLDFAEVARALDRGEAACRQLAARARAHIEEGRPRFPASREEGVRLAAAFARRRRAVGRRGNAGRSYWPRTRCSISDGGGKRAAALNLGSMAPTRSLRFLDRHRPAKNPALPGAQMAPRDRQRPCRFRAARGGRRDRHHRFRAPRRPHRRDLRDAQPGEAAPRPLLNPLAATPRPAARPNTPPARKVRAGPGWRT